MSSQAHADRLGQALERTGLAQVIRSKFSEGQVSVLFRILPGADAKWLELVNKLLRAEIAEAGHAHSWRTDISKPFFLKEEKGRQIMVFAWRVSVQAAQMSDSLDYFIRVIKGEARPEFAKGELTEMKFTGMEDLTDHNAPKPGSKKGVYRAETDPRR